MWLIPRYGVYTKAAILHDYLCERHPVSRRDADGIFRRALRELGVSVLRRWMMWAAVRAGGHWSGAGVGQGALWLLVAVPAAAFLAVPALVVTVLWLALFLALEWLVYAVTPPRVAPPANRPRFSGAPSTAGEASEGELRRPHRAHRIPASGSWRIGRTGTGVTSSCSGRSLSRWSATFGLVHQPPQVPVPQ